MTDIKEQATNYWTELLEALRADGLIAMAITQSREATTSFIVSKCSEPEPANGPWLPMTMFPQPGVQVVAAMHTGGKMCVLTYSEDRKWLDRDERGVDASMFTGWTFIKPPQEGEVK